MMIVAGLLGRIAGLPALLVVLLALHPVVQVLVLRVGQRLPQLALGDGGGGPGAQHLLTLGRPHRGAVIAVDGAAQDRALTILLPVLDEGQDVVGVGAAAAGAKALGLEVGQVGDDGSLLEVFGLGKRVLEQRGLLVHLQVGEALLLVAGVLLPVLGHALHAHVVLVQVLHAAGLQVVLDQDGRVDHVLPLAGQHHDALPAQKICYIYSLNIRLNTVLV